VVRPMGQRRGHVVWQVEKQMAGYRRAVVSARGGATLARRGAVGTQNKNRTICSISHLCPKTGSAKLLPVIEAKARSTFAVWQVAWEPPIDHFGRTALLGWGRQLPSVEVRFPVHRPMAWNPPSPAPRRRGDRDGRGARFDGSLLVFGVFAKARWDTVEPGRYSMEVRMDGQDFEILEELLDTFEQLRQRVVGSPTRSYLSLSRKLREDLNRFSQSCRCGSLHRRSRRRKSGELLRRILSLHPDVF
jgi:hypothetical protein